MGFICQVGLKFFFASARLKFTDNFGGPRLLQRHNSICISGSLRTCVADPVSSVVAIHSHLPLLKGTGNVTENARHVVRGCRIIAFQLTEWAEQIHVCSEGIQFSLLTATIHLPLHSGSVENQQKLTPLLFVAQSLQLFTIILFHSTGRCSCYSRWRLSYGCYDEYNYQDCIARVFRK